MLRVRRQVKVLLALLISGDVRIITRHFLHWLYSDSTVYGLKRDLTQENEPPASRVAVKVRAATEEDADYLFGKAARKRSRGDGYLLLKRESLFKAGIPQCYVAVDGAGTPCYAQWLIGAEYNAEIQSFFAGQFPVLSDDEALLEYAYTTKDARGQAIMSHALTIIAGYGSAIGARYVLTFVETRNAAALKACERAGFRPYIIQQTRWRLFARSVRYVELSDASDRD